MLPDHSMSSRPGVEIDPKRLARSFFVDRSVVCGIQIQSIIESFSMYPVGILLLPQHVYCHEFHPSYHLPLNP